LALVALGLLEIESVVQGDGDLRGHQAPEFEVEFVIDAGLIARDVQDSDALVGRGQWETAK
jgi:hypothetical protein